MDCANGRFPNSSLRQDSKIRARCTFSISSLTPLSVSWDAGIHVWTNRLLGARALT